MRGTPVDLIGRIVGPGIIPAYAGNTQNGDQEIRNGNGSSPHMRGTLALRRRLCKLFGIIPAYAGNTRQAAWSADWTGDHPRICGEHSYPAASTAFIAGSSPHMRGTRGSHVRTSDGAGIIPAYAGNTVMVSSPVACPKGSSPHMRGTP